MRRLILFAALSIVMTLTTACAKAPTEKLASAEQAVHDAQAIGSSAYMAEDLAKLHSMLATAKNEIDEQDTKFAFLRDYETSEQLLTALKTDADRIVMETSKKRDEAKAAAVQAQQAAQEAVKNAQDLVAKAPAGKDRAVVHMIRADVDGLRTSLNDVHAAIDAADYTFARAKAQAIQDKSQQVSAEIEIALAKVHKHTAAKKR